MQILPGVINSFQRVSSIRASFEIVNNPDSGNELWNATERQHRARLLPKVAI